MLIPKSRERQMFEVEKTFSFEAGHVLTHHDGPCACPHGHSYGLTVVVRGGALVTSGSKSGMVIDFQQIGEVVKPMIAEYLDHHWLNETLKTDTPTAESIAKWVFDYLWPRLPGLHRICIRETASSCASYMVDEE